MKNQNAEAHLYRIIKVARNEDLIEQIGRDIYFDLVDHDKVHSFRIQKQMPFHLFKEEVAKEFGIPMQFQRFWLWAKRLNHTYRPHRPLTVQEEAQSVGQLREISNKAHNAELKLFLEVKFGTDLCPIPHEKAKEDILLFFKLYDPEKEELRYVGRLFVKGSGKPVEIFTKLNEMAHFAPNEEIELYEEIKFEPNVLCEPIDKKLTFRACQLEDGDIICFQKSPSVDDDEQCRYPSVPVFLEFVHNRQIRMKKEQEEKEHKKKEKAEAHLYRIIKVARNEDLVEQIGRDIYFDLVDHDKVRSFRIQKQMPFNLFKEEVAKEFGIPVQFQRFWLWIKRQNHTYRPHRPLTVQEEAQSVGQLKKVSNKAHNAELKLFLEDLRLIPPERTREDILLFFKLYDPEKEELRYVGRLFVMVSGKPVEILTKLNEMARFAPNEEIELYEEIKFEPNVMCEPIDKNLTFRASQLEDGDIICFQKSPLVDGDERCRYPNVPSFLEYVHNCQVHLIEPSLSLTPSTAPEPITPISMPPTSMGPPASSLAPRSPVRLNTEELHSIVNKYPISDAHKSTWRDVVKKYGDITHKSNIKNLKVKAAYIETICDIISGLKRTAAQGLKMTSINQCESDLEEVESTQIDVSWLKEHLHMLKTILAQSRQFSVMGDSFKVKTERLAKLTASIAEDNSKIENAQKEMAKQEALIMESLERLEANEEEFVAVQHAITSQQEEFVLLRTAAEKLLYYGTRGFTLDLL